jgi:hypothetical protein
MAGTAALLTGTTLTLQDPASDAVQNSRQAAMTMGLVRVLGPRLARVIARDIPGTAATEGFDVVRVRRMRVIGAVGVPGAFAVRYLASRKVPCASPAGGVPEQKIRITLVSWSCLSYWKWEKKKGTYSP